MITFNILVSTEFLYTSIKQVKIRFIKTIIVWKLRNQGKEDNAVENWVWALSRQLIHRRESDGWRCTQKIVYLNSNKENTAPKIPMHPQEWVQFEWLTVFQCSQEFKKELSVLVVVYQLYNYFGSLPGILYKSWICAHPVTLG